MGRGLLVTERPMVRLAASRRRGGPVSHWSEICIGIGIFHSGGGCWNARLRFETSNDSYCNTPIKKHFIPLYRVVHYNTHIKNVLIATRSSDVAVSEILSLGGCAQDRHVQQLVAFFGLFPD